MRQREWHRTSSVLFSFSSAFILFLFSFSFCTKSFHIVLPPLRCCCWRSNSQLTTHNECLLSLRLSLHILLLLHRCTRRTHSTVDLNYNRVVCQPSNKHFCCLRAKSHIFTLIAAATNCWRPNTYGVHAHVFRCKHDQIDEIENLQQQQPLPRQRHLCGFECNCPFDFYCLCCVHTIQFIDVCARLGSRFTSSNNINSGEWVEICVHKVNWEPMQWSWRIELGVTSNIRKQAVVGVCRTRLSIHQQQQRQRQQQWGRQRQRTNRLDQ